MLFRLCLRVLGDSRASEGGENDGVPHDCRESELGKGRSAYSIHDVLKHREGDWLSLRATRRGPLLRCGENAIKKRDVKSVAATVRRVTKKPRVRVSFRNDRRNRRAEVILNCLDVGCGATSDTLTFGYFLGVSSEDRARFFGGGVLESGVGESFCLTPILEVRGSICCSASVALSSCSPVTGLDTTQNR